MAAEKKAKDAGQQPRAFLRMGRFKDAQEFSFLAGQVSQKVDVVGDLSLTDEEGTELFQGGNFRPACARRCTLAPLH